MLTIDPGDMVLISGASGSGKSSVLRILTGSFQDASSSATVEGVVEGLNPEQVSELDANWDSDRSLVDLVGHNTDNAIALLNTVGLSEAHLYVKCPSQISEGQRYRFAIARLCDSGSPVWVADEFATALDPMTSAVAAKGLRKLAFKRGATVILAAPHITNFVESLHPNKLVYLSWGSAAKIYSADSGYDRSVAVDLGFHFITPGTNQLGQQRSSYT
jgi:ABC-type ATPase with predicted acetyltransferase domain